MRNGVNDLLHVACVHRRGFSRWVITRSPALDLGNWSTQCSASWLLPQVILWIWGRWTHVTCPRINSHSHRHKPSLNSSPLPLPKPSKCNTVLLLYQALNSRKLQLFLFCKEIYFLHSWYLYYACNQKQQTQNKKSRAKGTEWAGVRTLPFTLKGTLNQTKPSPRPVCWQSTSPAPQRISPPMQKLDLLTPTFQVVGLYQNRRAVMLHQKTEVIGKTVNHKCYEATTRWPREHNPQAQAQNSTLMKFSRMQTVYIE